MPTIVEKVILLQGVDVFSQVSTEQLALLAAIAEETEHAADETIYREGDASDSMYLVLDGRVRLHRGDTEVTTAEAGAAFGTWALFDDDLRVTSATATGATRVLCIHKEDFIELLADNVDITRGVLKAIVKRLRGIAGVFGARQG